MGEFMALLAQETEATAEPFIRLLEQDNEVSFPNLGIFLKNLSVGVKIGPLSIRWYGLIICLAMVLCIILGMRRAPSYGISKDDLFDYIIFGIPISIIGARLYFVLFRLSDYASNPAKIFAIWEGGLAIYGGVIAVALVCLVATRIKKKSFLHLIDFVLPYVMLGQGIGRWGNFFNQEAHGTATDTVFGMTGNLIAKEMGTGVLVHPTFLYESLWCLAGFAFIAIYRKKLQKNVGEITALYMIIYGVERAIVEGLRTDSLTFNIGSFVVRVSQWLSVALVVIGIALFIDTRIKGKSLAGIVAAYKESEALKADKAGGGEAAAAENCEGLPETEEKAAETEEDPGERSSFADIVDAMKEEEGKEDAEIERTE